VLLAATAHATYDKQSIIDSAGRQAAAVEDLWWMFFWVLAVIYFLVLVFLGLSIWKKRIAPPLGPAGVYIPKAPERAMTLTVSVAVVVTVIILFVFLMADFATGRKLNALSSAPDPLIVQVKAQQWWWEFKYRDDTTSSNTVTTANELHLPLGKPVKIELNSPDVIHSFWIPNLMAKHDVVPGYPYAVFLQADRAGDFIGQCAEFCGHQHAHMRFTVKTEPKDNFEKWLTAQRATPPPPQTPSQRRGQQVFLGASCAMCHTIGGTPARATVGPNLTHIASRPSLAAGTLPNNRGNLAGWILDPQHTKPGTRMPQNALTSDDLQALLDYLETLK
jgi:cytochrome c oxidase subunit 2